MTDHEFFTESNESKESGRLIISAADDEDERFNYSPSSIQTTENESFTEAQPQPSTIVFKLFSSKLCISRRLRKLHVMPCICFAILSYFVVDLIPNRTFIFSFLTAICFSSSVIRFPRSKALRPVFWVSCFLRTSSLLPFMVLTAACAF